MIRTLVVLPALAAALAAAPVRAQDAPADSAPPPPNGLRQGAWSLTFQFPTVGGGELGELGAWKMVDARTNLGISLSATLTDRSRETDGHEDSEVHTSVALGLNARRYAATARRVAPYVQARLAAGRGHTRRTGDGVDGTVRAVFASATAAAGAEWFPTPQFSVAGHTGVTVFASRRTYDGTGAQGDEREARDRDLSLDTLTSTLSLRIYF